MDRDECRFAQASRQMFEQAALPLDEQDRRIDSATGLPGGMHSGGWVVPMYGTKPRLNKPPLTYWVQVASAAVMTGGHPERDAMWMYRLPSVLSAIGTVLIVWRLGLKMFDPRAAWLGAVLLAVSPMIVWDAHQARSDQLLTLCTTGAMACLWGVVGRVGASRGLGKAEFRLDQGAAAGSEAKPRLAPGPRLRRGLVVVGLWVCVGLGVMTKGFITPLVVLGAVGAMCVVKRSWRPLWATRPVVGMVIVLLVAAPWVWLLSWQVGLDVYAREVWKETFLRSDGGEGRWAGVFAAGGASGAADRFVLAGVLVGVAGGGAGG
ncbi:MAG: glycosyltransferase family 39 protein [Phycisphaerales bacterium]